MIMSTNPESRQDGGSCARFLLYSLRWPFSRCYGNVRGYVRTWQAQSRDIGQIRPYDMIHRLLAVAAWALLAFIVYATFSPIQARPTLPAPSGLEHLAAYALL